MALALVWAVLALFYPSLAHSTGGGNNSKPNCPASFDCSTNGSFGYPFYNSTTDPRCGLCKLDCSGGKPIIQLGEGFRPYEISRRYWSSGFVVHDQKFQDLLNTHSCNTFDTTYSLPTTKAISFTVSKNITLFKCQINSSSAIDQYFGDYNSYKNCGIFNMYYKSQYNNNYGEGVPIPPDLPATCEVLQLPVSSQDPLKSANFSDLFSLLAADFVLDIQVSPQCLKCRHESGLCVAENDDEFQCDYAENDAGRKRTSPILFIGISGVVFILSIICLVKLGRNFISSCFKSEDKYIKAIWRKNNLNVETFLKNQKFLSPKRYSYLDVKKMTNYFKVQLGKGGYGSVYRGTLNNGSLVAVKVLNESKGSGEDFMNEVGSVSRTSHVNIVSLLGFCVEGRKRALIYEFMSNGSLEKFIYDKSSLAYSQLCEEKLYQIAIGIAKGLEYLHRGCSTRICHFDIKPHNILLDQDFCPKISDFGLAKLFPDKRSVFSMSGMRGTLGYIAPELFSRHFGVISHKSDVYSYGMMIIEMVCGRENNNDGVDRSSDIYFPNWIYKQLDQEDGPRMQEILNEEENERARKMIIVGLWCIQTDPSNRPSMQRVLEMLEGSLESLQIPPKPTLCTSRLSFPEIDDSTVSID